MKKTGHVVMTTTTAAHDANNKKNNTNTEQGKGTQAKNTRTRNKNGNGNNSTPEVVLEGGDDDATATAEDTASNPHEQHCRRPRVVRAAKALPSPTTRTLMMTKAAHQDGNKRSSSNSKATTPETGREAKQKYKKRKRML